jgi:diguanylate cyclase (GGDEF)-like protein
MDVDNFKHFNDTNGHPAGDQLLIDLARILQNEIGKRASDIVARYGGEEFIMALPFTPHEGVLVVAERVREIIENHPFAHREKQPLKKVSVSIGVATFPDHADQQSSLIEKADKALYQAKRSGRNRVVSYNDVATTKSEDLASVAEVVSASTAVPTSTSTPTPVVTNEVVPDKDRPTIGQVLAANENQMPSPQGEAPVEQPIASLPEVFDLDHLITSIDAAFFDAEAKADHIKVEAKKFGTDSLESTPVPEKKENHGS